MASRNISVRVSVSLRASGYGLARWIRIKASVCGWMVRLAVTRTCARATVAARGSFWTDRDRLAHVRRPTGS